MPDEKNDTLRIASLGARVYRERMHPEDSTHVDEWRIYGPRNVEIPALIEALAKKGVRLSEIEATIQAMLEQWLAGLGRNE
jgi:hypothetical protein